LRLSHLLPPETAHRLAVRALPLLPSRAALASPRLRTRLCGLNLPNPVGLAAGFDKNAEAFAGALRQGFGWVEIGSVTPRPQAGNPRPRLFRLVEDEAVINRMGFNNDGLEAAAGRLAGRDPSAGIVGANIGINKDSTDPVGDYVLGLRRLLPLVDYVTVNISSPNTPGLRGLQRREPLERLLADGRERLRFVRCHQALLSDASRDPQMRWAGPAMLHLAHVRMLLESAGTTGDLDAQTDALSMLLEADYVGHQLNHRSRSLEDLVAAWEDTARKLCGH